MTEPTSPRGSSATRRDFLRSSTAATVGLGLLGNAHAAGSDVIKVGLIGCGGRGTGAAENICEAAGTSYNIKLHAMGDVFPDHLSRTVARACRTTSMQGEVRRRRRPLLRRVRRLSEGHRLLRPGDAGHAAGLPAAAHRGGHQGGQEPLHREAGRRRRPGHPQGPGRRRGGEEEGPLRRRRHPAPPPGRLRREHEADPRRRDRRPDHGPRLLEPGGHLGPQARSRAGATSSTSSATGTTSPGSAATTSSSSTSTTSTSPTGRWAAHPIKAVGMGGRQVHDEPERGQSYDHFAVDYEFPGGIHILSMARQIDGCANNVSETIVGTKGTVEQPTITASPARPGPGSASNTR